MRLSNDSWVPGQSGIDINTGLGQSITVAPVPHNAAECWKETLATLNNLNNLHQKSIDAIESFIAKAKVNQGSTAPTSQKFSVISPTPAVMMLEEKKEELWLSVTLMVIALMGISSSSKASASENLLH
jgi:hypothetical protein